MLFVFLGVARRELELLLESLWWRWLAAAGRGWEAPRWWAAGEPERASELPERLGLGLRWEKRALPCGLQRCSGVHCLH